MIDDSRGAAPDRIVLHIRSGGASPLALEAATRLARTMHAEIECVFVEDDEILTLAELPFAREISPTGRRTRALSADEVLREMRSRSQAVRRAVEHAARMSDIRCHFTAVRQSPDKSFEKLSSQARILIYGEAIGDDAPARFPRLTRCFGSVDACLLHGSRVRRSRGPVIIVIDDLASSAPMAEIVRYWTEGRREDVILSVLGSVERSGQMLLQDMAARLPEETALRIQIISEDRPERALADIATRSGAGLIVARQHGPLATDDARLTRVVTALDCPLLLLRCVSD